ncbi:Dabb family protein [Paraburkholderia sp. J67]|uniref:Dabb family protein n=1 Tax=Paraburkholderia sp. J67 TaxID=2805435 RepID=UPI002ABD5CEE|nr:Dabb family protein [Paraburkholderia sp. J67]
MIRHIVMWSVAGQTEQQRIEARLRVKSAFEGLRGRIPGMRSLDVGIDFSDVDYACDVVLVAEFESRRSLDDYATHPEHAQVRAQLNGLRIARHQVDYVVEC